MADRRAKAGRPAFGVRQLRIIRARTDYALILAVAALLILGLMMVYSSTFDMAFRVWDDAGHFIKRQLIWTALGVGVMIVLARVDYHLWERWSVLMLAGTLLVLGIVVLLGGTQFGATRWLLPGGSVQPSEFAKISVIIYIAAWVTSKGDKIRQISYGLLPFAILIGLVTGLVVLQPSLSTALLIAATACAMFFFAGADLLQLSAIGVFGAATLFLLIALEPFRMKRIATFVDRNADPNDSSFQVIQGLIALASGGLLGKGPGASSQKFEVLPAAHTDAIVAVLGEELGLIGCLVLIGLFVLLTYRGYRIALDAADPFGTVLAAGLTSALALQALGNLAVVTATVPYAGIPLPFVSYGGSSMLTSMASVGLLLSIARGRFSRGGGIHRRSASVRSIQAPAER